MAASCSGSFFIKIDGPFDAFIEAYSRSPSELSLELSARNCVPEVVPRSIGYIYYVFFALVQMPQKHVCYFEICIFFSASDIIDLAVPPLSKDKIDCPNAVIHVEPAADVLTFCVERNFFLS